MPGSPIILAKKSISSGGQNGPELPVLSYWYLYYVKASSTEFAAAHPRRSMVFTRYG